MWTGTQIAVAIILIVITNLVTGAIVYNGITSQNQTPDMEIPEMPIIEEEDVTSEEYNSLDNLRYLRTEAVVQYDFTNNTIALVEFTHYRLAKNGWELHLGLENMVTLTKCNQWGTELRSCQLKVIGDRGVELYINYSCSYGNTWDTENVYFGTVMFRPQDIDGRYSWGAGYPIRSDTGLEDWRDQGNPVGKLLFRFEDSDPHIPGHPDRMTLIFVARLLE